MNDPALFYGEIITKEWKYINDFLKISFSSAAFSKASVREHSPTNNISDVIFYCSVGERLRALALLNVAENRCANFNKTWHKVSLS